MIIWFIIGLCLALFIVGSITDIRWRIVPDWLSYAGVATGLSLRAMMSVDQLTWTPLIEGLLGAGLFFGMGAALFYLKQWGGGDAKILMAFGAIAGLQFSVDALLPSFFINLVFLGGLYGLGWFLALAIMKFSKVSVEAKKMMSTKAVSMTQGGVYVAVLALLAAGFFLKVMFPFVVLSAGVLFVFYLMILTKSVEKTCFVVDKKIKDLEEGDWVVEDIKVGKKVLIHSSNVGLSKKDIALLKKHQKKLKTVTIKEGIPFVPSFLLTFIVTILIGNIILVAMVL